MRNRCLVMILCIAAAFCNTCTKEEKAQNKALVSFLVGEAFSYKESSWQALQVGSELTEGDKIKTQNASVVDIQIGTSLIRIKENSEVTMSRIITDQKTSLENNAVELQVGTLLAKPKKLMKGESFLVKTPTAVAGVRGTLFMVESDKEKDTKISVLDGKVKVTQRIAALEAIEDSAVKDAEVVKQIEEKIEETSVTVTENKSVAFEAKTVERVNEKVEKVVQAVEAVQAVEKNEDKKAEKNEERKGEKKAELPKIEVAVVLEEIKAAPQIKPVEIKNDTTELKQEFESIKKVEIIEKPKEPETSAVEDVKEEKEAETAKEAEPVKEEKTAIAVEPVKQMKAVKAVEPVKEAPLKAVFSINVNPGNARVFFNGELKGNGSVKLPLDPGTVTVRVEAEGYKEIQKEYVVNPGAKIAEKIVLERLKPIDTVVWKLDAGDTTQDMIYSGAYIYIATGKGMIVCLNGDRATQVWSMDMKSRVTSGMAADKKNLYFSTANERFWAVDTASGKTRWSVPVAGAVINGLVPVVTANAVYLATSRGNVYRFTPAGRLVWNKVLPAGVFESPFLVNNGDLMIPAGDGRLYSLSAADGKQLWASDLGRKFKLVYNGGALYAVSYYGTVCAIKSDTGSTIWKKDMLTQIIVSPLLLKDRLVLAGLNGKVMAVDLFNGETVFTKDLGGPVRSNLTLNEGLILVPSGKKLYVLDPAGKVQLSYEAPSRITTSASIAGNEIFVGLDGGKTYSFSRKNDRGR